MNKDREHIQGLFDNDGIKAPDSLSEERMLDLLESTEEKQSTDPKSGSFEKRRPARRPALKRVVSLAAAALIAVAGIGGLTALITAPPDTSTVNGELYTFKNEREIKNLVNKLDKSPRISLQNIGDEELIEDETPLSDGALQDSGSSSAVAVSKSSGASHSETYLQVDSVDEADIIKTDGKYIYYVTDDREVVILSAEEGKTEKLATIGNSGIENYIDDIYVKGDRLITVGTVYKDDSDEELSGIVVYDISDRSNPQLLYDFNQTGNILASRMIGDYIYLVTSDYVYKGGRTVPKCGSGSLTGLSASDICCMPDPDAASYIVLSAVDIAANKQSRPVTKAVLGAGGEIFCSDRNLYCTASEYDEKSDVLNTRIVRAGLDGTKIRFNATTKVRGYINDQFSMDENGSYFRIATTSERAGMDVNNLYILDADLKESGKVTGFARNESIKAVRYVGSKAYVITYEAIDPLFVIDLSDPSAPRIEGEVKIDGFSTLLIPISSSRLLGIGHATGDNGYGGEYDSGLKLALFDISDPAKPKVLDSKEFENMSSIAQYDHHALMVNSEEGYYAIPYEVWNDTLIDDGGVLIDEPEESSPQDDSIYVEPETAYETGMLLFKADDTISQTDRHKLEGQQIYRGVYIGEWVYALDAEGNVQSFKPSF